MQLKDVMTRDVEVVHPYATLAAAAAKMEALDVGLLPVCDGTRLVGMVSDRRGQESENDAGPRGHDR